MLHVFRFFNLFGFFTGDNSLLFNFPNDAVRVWHRHPFGIVLHELLPRPFKGTGTVDLVIAAQFTQLQAKCLD